MTADMYVVIVEGPDGSSVRRAFSYVTLRDVKAGPLEPHAKAAYLASIEIEAAFDRGELDEGHGGG